MKCSGRFKFTILFIYPLLGYTTSSLSFFLVHLHRVVEGARQERHEKRELLFVLLGLPPSFLASRGFAARASVHSPHWIWRKSETASNLFHLPQDAVDGLVTMTSGAFEPESWFAWNGSDVKSICASKQWINIVHTKVVYFVIFDFFINGLICQVILEIEWTIIQWRQ